MHFPIENVDSKLTKLKPNSSFNILLHNTKDDIQQYELIQLYQ